MNRSERLGLVAIAVSLITGVSLAVDHRGAPSPPTEADLGSPRRVRQLKGAIETANAAIKGRTETDEVVRDVLNGLKGEFVIDLSLKDRERGDGGLMLKGTITTGSKLHYADQDDRAQINAAKREVEQERFKARTELSNFESRWKRQRYYRNGSLSYRYWNGKKCAKQSVDISESQYAQRRAVVVNQGAQRIQAAESRLEQLRAAQALQRQSAWSAARLVEVQVVVPPEVEGVIALRPTSKQVKVRVHVTDATLGRNPESLGGAIRVATITARATGPATEADPAATRVAASHSP